MYDVTKINVENPKIQSFTINAMFPCCPRPLPFAQYMHVCFLLRYYKAEFLRHQREKNKFVKAS